MCVCVCVCVCSTLICQLFVIFFAYINTNTFYRQASGDSQNLAGVSLSMANTFVGTNFPHISLLHFTLLLSLCILFCLVCLVVLLSVCLSVCMYVCVCLCVCLLCVYVSVFLFDSFACVLFTCLMALTLTHSLSLHLSHSLSLSLSRARARAFPHSRDGRVDCGQIPVGTAVHMYLTQ